ncbi:MAG: hypothetical protein ACI4RT_05240 [Candidatus Spyradenecus sp.]
MGIDGINGNSQVTWTSFLNAVDEASKAGKLGEVTIEKGSEGVTFSVKEGDSVRTAMLSFPELEAPANVDQAAIGTLVEKLSAGDVLNLSAEEQAKLLEDLKAMLSGLLSAAASEGVSTSSSSSSSVFFNLYQLMTLLAQVAQELRDSTREIRSAENQAVQASIQNQANQQRSAALFGMIGGAIVCAVQVVATGVGLSKQASAFKSQLSAQHQSGVSRAHADLQMAELQASPSDAARNYQTKVNQMGPQKANEVLATFEGSQRAGEAYANSQAKVANLEMRQKALQGVEPQFATDEQVATARAKVTTAEQQLTDAQTALDTTTEQLTTEHTKLLAANEQLPKAQNDLVYLQEQKAAAEADIQNMQQALDEVPELPQASENLRTSIAEKQAQVQSLNEKIAAKQTEIQKWQQTKDDATAKIDQLQPQKTAQQAAVDQAQTDVDTAKQELETLLQKDDAAKVERELPGAKEQLENDRLAYRAALKSEASQARSAYEDALANNSPDAKELQQRAELAEAYAAKELSGISTGEEKATAITDANNAYKQADALLTHSEKFQTAQYNSDRARAFNDLISVLGNLGNTLIRGAADMMNAEATSMAADQKAAEEELEEVKDLFQGAGDLANAILQLMQGVQQSENDSMQEAIRA